MLEEVKGYLNITWSEDNAKIQSLISRGQAYLDDLTGTTLDYSDEKQPKALLLDYCRYAYNNALEYFEENYNKEILRLQLNVGISEMVMDDEV